MEGKKIELARQAAIGVVENLRPIDLVGVLIFDNSFQWDVPIRRAGRQGLDQAPDLGNRSRRRHADRACSGGGLSQSASHARHVQAHRAAHRRHLGRGRQSRSVERSGSPARDHLHGWSRPGREPRLSGESGLGRRREIVLPERTGRTRANCAERRDGAHRLHRRREDVAAIRGEERRDSGRRRHRRRAAAQRLCSVHQQADRRHHPQSRSKWIRCWSAGSTDWAAQLSLPRMPRAAGRPIG